MKNEFNRKSNKRRNEFSTTRLKRKTPHYFDNYNNNIIIYNTKYYKHRVITL